MIQAAEFFAGMGLMRAGLESAGIGTAFANDIDETKATIYRDNWGADELDVNDIRALTGDDIPDVDLATASFPWGPPRLGAFLISLSALQTERVSGYQLREETGFTHNCLLPLLKR